MSTYDNLPPSKPAPRRVKDHAVFCVGWRAFVNWPQHAAPTHDPVPLTDPEGKPLGNDLVDGQEVEIISWRPQAREGSMYQVRRLHDDREWWINAIYLRKQKQAAAPVANPG